MDNYYSSDFSNLSHDSQRAASHIVDLFFKKIYPLIVRIRDKLQTNYSSCRDDLTKIKDTFVLCCSQIKKCVLNLFDIFKLEHRQELTLQESRIFTLERLSWCFNRLTLIEDRLKKYDSNLSTNESSNDSIFVTPMYFINWIDHSFEILAKLSEIAYRTDYKDDDHKYEQWKKELVDCISELHITLDELLLSAMTLCKYYLPTDQHVVKARCQVVLRETKALLSELIKEDVTAAFNVTPDSIKLPIMPSNVNVLIDVLKDVLYVLETNTNTALLSLLVHCFCNNRSPVDILRDHFKEKKGGCVCHVKSKDDIIEDCTYVKEFDFYNERLLQIGSFAISCSSDQNRILLLRSGLASLEALDPHLVPALMLSPESPHSKMLMSTWRQEVEEIRDSVFLIVDPTALAEKSKQIMHQKLLDIIKQNCYNNNDVCSLINVGTVVYSFFDVYNKHEPDVLICYEKLSSLLVDLNIVLSECKIVSNILSSGEEFLYEVKKTKSNKEVSMEQLLKRLKLLYTIINRINNLLHPEDDEDNLFNSEMCHEQQIINNLTQTLENNVGKTYVNPPKVIKNNASRSIFVRTSNIRSPADNFPLKMLTKYLERKNNSRLSFSVQLDELFNTTVNKGRTLRVRDSSVLYDVSPRKRSSLRKAVLNRRYTMSNTKEFDDENLDLKLDTECIVDETTSLQITEILDQMQDITNLFSKSQLSQSTKTVISVNAQQTNIQTDVKEQNNVLTLDINNGNTTISKYLWNIPVNTSTVEMPSNDNNSTNNESNVTQPSNVTTLERINDLDLVESKLNDLKYLQQETSL